MSTTKLAEAAQQYLIATAHLGACPGTRDVLERALAAVAQAEAKRQPLQAGMSNDKLRAAFLYKLPGVTPTDNELSAFALGAEVGHELARAALKAFPAVQVVVERERVWIKRGKQSFMLGYEAETEAEREWYAGQLRTALSGFTPDVKTQAEAKPADECIYPACRHNGCREACEAKPAPADPCLALWQAMNEAEKYGQRTDDKLIVKFLREAGYVIAPAAPAPAVEPVAESCHVVHVVMKEDGTIHLKKGDRSTWVGYKSDDKADQEWRAGCISRLLGHSGWDAAAPAAPAKSMPCICEFPDPANCGAPCERQPPAAPVPADVRSGWSTPTTYAHRFAHAVSLLCGKWPDAALVDSWLDKSSDALQDFAASHGPAWAQGIVLLDAAAVIADTPTEGVEHGERAPAAPAPDRTGMTYYKNNDCKAVNADAADCICWTPAPAAPAPDLQSIEQYRMQMAGISTAALGYWTEEDGIHPDYDTVPLRDVAKLYAKYAALYKAAAHAHVPEADFGNIKPLTDEQIEGGRSKLFSVGNPFCPITEKAMRTAVRWAERCHGIAASKGEQA